MSSKTLIAAAAGFVVLFLLAFLFYGWLLMDFFTANAGSVAGAMKESPDWPWLVIGEFLGALTLAVILGWAGVRTVGEGIQKGAVFGFLVALTVGFIWLGTANISTLASTLVDSLVTALRYGAAGAVVGMLFGRDPTA
jgi:hypothetical protein